mmetsp:Transcript_10537/g.20333  ORF Transcript_10537/g.20333 Transcript_10537/m.20333 type:complete len:255 (-) Transcript_10537:27-791(-)
MAHILLRPKCYDKDRSVSASDREALVEEDGERALLGLGFGEPKREVQLPGAPIALSSPSKNVPDSCKSNRTSTSSTASASTTDAISGPQSGMSSMESAFFPNYKLRRPDTPQNYELKPRLDSGNLARLRLDFGFAGTGWKIKPELGGCNREAMPAASRECQDGGTGSCGASERRGRPHRRCPTERLLEVVDTSIDDNCSTPPAAEAAEAAEAGAAGAEADKDAASALQSPPCKVFQGDRQRRRHWMVAPTRTDP